MNQSSDPSQLVGKDIIAWNPAQKNSKPSLLLPVLAASSRRSAVMPPGAYRQNSQGFSWAGLGRHSVGGNQQPPGNNSQHLFCWKINAALALPQRVRMLPAGLQGEHGWQSHSILLLPPLDGDLQRCTADSPAAGELSWHSTRPRSGLPSRSHTPVVLKGL